VTASSSSSNIGPLAPLHVVQDQPSSLERSVLDFLVHGKKGVLSFVYSMMLTRGLTRLREDMDDMESSLTMGPFGHGTQELLNLMLTGRATSNVFDGTMPMGDSGLVLRGVAARPSVGYLTHLEALRYCTVGSFYKTPRYPVWVLGSATHLTVLCGTDLRLCEESSSDALLGRVQQVFKRFIEYDVIESGFISLDALVPCLRALEVRCKISTNILSQKTYTPFTNIFHR
jgi:hypothetical protein